MTTNDLVALSIFLLPLAAFLVIFFITRPLKALSGFLAVASIGTTFVLSVYMLFQVLAAPDRTLQLFSFPWLTIGDLVITFGFRVDPLTAIMLIVVTSVSTLVQIYSNGYMSHDPGFSRFFIYMTLFTFSMLGLILVDNLIFIYVFWELVGLCSYLLIGFWFRKPSAAAAAKKAFIVTRIGDFGFMIGILLVWVNIGTFGVTEIIAAVPELPALVVTGIALGTFAGAVGKSAQFPLHFWLPDAMEGPTPVSALVHSATMVAAGVYLIARFFPVFYASPDALLVVALIGGFTAFFAATMGLVMNDIKRVLAYSTISQLGLMVLALGVGGFVPAVFHLMNHAFFKALLFMGSGSVNHATNTYDMRLMGGLRKYMPWTYGTFLIAALSLAGIPPLSGFWSKDEIVVYVFNSKMDVQPLLVFFMVATTFMTAFYMFRAIFLTFHGQYKGGEAYNPADHGIDPDEAHGHGHDDAHAPAAAAVHADAGHDAAGHGGHDAHPEWKSHPHESPWLMVLPLVILVVPSVLSGFLNAPPTFILNSFLKTDAFKAATGITSSLPFDLTLAAVSTAVAASGILLAFLMYQVKVIPANFLTRFFPWVYTAISNKYGVDILAEDLITTRMFKNVICTASAWFDRFIIDGVVNGVGRTAVNIGYAVRLYETGQVQVYGFSIFIGLIVIVAGFVFLRPV